MMMEPIGDSLKRSTFNHQPYQPYQPKKSLDSQPSTYQPNRGQVEDTAAYIRSKLHGFGEGRSIEIAYRLNRLTIDRLITLALEKGKNPGAYFNILVKKEMK